MPSSDPLATDETVKWWQTIETWVNCYHPHAERYKLCPQVEKCGVCKEVRFVSEDFWPPVTKAMSEGVTSPRSD